MAKNPITTATGKPSPIAFDERVLKNHLVDFQVMDYSDLELAELEGNYTPEA